MLRSHRVTAQSSLGDRRASGAGHGRGQIDERWSGGGRAMRKAMAFLLGMLLPVFGLAHLGLAQSAVQLQGTIQSVDCQSQSVVLTGSSGWHLRAATGATA